MRHFVEVFIAKMQNVRPTASFEDYRVRASYETVLEGHRTLYYGN